jgi:hypothetical protein
VTSNRRSPASWMTEGQVTWLVGFRHLPGPGTVGRVQQQYLHSICKTGTDPKATPCPLECYVFWPIGLAFGVLGLALVLVGSN